VILDTVNLLNVNDIGDGKQKYIDIVNESFDLFGDDIAASHLKDFRLENGKLINMPIGTGLAPFHYLLKLAADKKPYLPLIMEEQHSSTIEKSFDFMEKLIPLE
jgi:L-ribulose-5-phosphate 3-epimerase UlaE